MDLMMRRNALLAQIQNGLGEYTKGYYAVLTPQSANEFVIQHNLGIMPKVCIIEAKFEPEDGNNIALNSIYRFDVLVDDTSYECRVCEYFYENNITSYVSVSATEHRTLNSLTLPPLYSASRSPWNINGTYIVRVMG